MEKLVRIMLVEDNREYRDVIQFALEDEPQMELVGPFATAEMALSSLQRDEEVLTLLDIILLDLRLPGMSGLKAIPFFREIIPTAKIIILSQSDSEDDVIEAITLGASGYLLKSATIQQVKESIQSVLEGGASLDPQVARYLVRALKSDPLKSVSAKFLTKREREVLELLADGLPKKSIADTLCISYATVDTHVQHIYEKLNVNNAPAAVRSAYQMGIFSK